MDIDTTQPWGLAIDFAGRATITEAGHTVYVNVSDSSYNSVIAPDSVTGIYSPVTVTAQFTESGTNSSALRGSGRVSVMPVGTAPVIPDQTAIQRAVAAALADFVDSTAAYTALCTKWTPTDDGSGDGGDGSGDDGTTDSTSTTTPV
ncbi:ATP-binding protein [Streptomyces sp. NBC_00988]|uniref:ATP-binding protein n=1 Tax=Streptomyces sp. NBC_00988 TaxID=2903704 RepID=UPI0038679C75|nr:ATP-binding protein [Streptomyces sp. NBC_00988]